MAFHRGLLGREFEDGPSRSLLALFERAQARDLVDVAALVDRFGLERRCEREGRWVLRPSRDARPTDQV